MTAIYEAILEDKARVWKSSELKDMLRRSLSKRIRITADPHKRGKASTKLRRYYEKYTVLVSETLKEPSFQTFVHSLLKKENMEVEKIADVQIKTFPVKKENGNSLVGKCSNKGVICLYPQGIRFWRKRMPNGRKDEITFYIKCRARAALIHEILHTKYLSKEGRVRELTRKYFNAFMRRNELDQNKQRIIQKIFPTAPLHKPEQSLKR
ncbi:hypothetical protein AC480_04850 [miscellaneous Crenarchaeota group archaeon SMTZ1-55]|nr:MAG: hypothetical protein AC480_04850 [miscellaneous Crenarchaeota group archaeon SMTZ1-55]